MAEYFTIPTINIPDIKIPGINISPIRIPAINIPAINTELPNWIYNSMVVTTSSDNLQTVSPGINYSILSNSQVLGEGSINIRQSVNGVVSSTAILSGLGNDTVTGSDGIDLLAGGLGNDLITTGTGADSIVFRTPTEGIDTITDFSVTDDKIVVSASGFGAGLIPPSQDIQSVALPIEQFVIGSTPTNQSTRFIYDPANGSLFFDADGNGPGAQVQFAQLPTALAFTNQNIQLIN